MPAASTSEDDARALAAAILSALAQERAGTGMSLPRLGKRLGLRSSVLMRSLAYLGEADIGGVPGPGWVRLDQQDGHWVARLTDAGHGVAQGLGAAPAPMRSPGTRMA